MKIPKKWCRIGGHKIKVSYDKTRCEDNDAAGLFTRRGDIILNPDQSKSQAEETFIHEAIEAANEMYELGLDHHRITVLGVAIHQALTDCK